MTTILAALQNSLLVLDSTRDGWKVYERLKQYNLNSLVVDPHNSSRAYCGTFDSGLWKTNDNGLTWEKTFLDNIGSHITSVSVSPIEMGKSGFGRVFVGTEPSTILSSIDGGTIWEKIENFNVLPSHTTWSFPPRPSTHHVRWIEPDTNNENYVFAAIEAGALVRTFDGGKTWMDRVKNGPYDTHKLVTNKNAPGKLYSAAGDGYFESEDYGNTWNNVDDGLKDHTYLFSIALNSGHHKNMIVSAANNAWKSHDISDLESFIYRRSVEEEEDQSSKWELVRNGLPESKGTFISILDSNPHVEDEFYCLNNRGIFVSEDSGLSWKSLEIPWPKEYKLQHPWALAIR